MYTRASLPILQPEISLVPLIGVLQALLLVVMTQAPVRDQAQEFLMPIPSDCFGKCPTVQLRTIEVQANGEGEIDLRLEGESVDLLTLLARLRHARGSDRLALSMETGMDVPYGELARLLATLQRAGFEDIRFAELYRYRLPSHAPTPRRLAC